MKRRAFLAAAWLAVVLCVVGIALLAHTTLIAMIVADEAQTSFFVRGNADSLCEDVLPRGGVFVTCEGFLYLNEEKVVTLKGFVIVFPSRSLAEQDKRDRLNRGAIGAVVLASPQGMPLEENRRLQRR